MSWVTGNLMVKHNASAVSACLSCSMVLLIIVYLYKTFSFYDWCGARLVLAGHNHKQCLVTRPILSYKRSMCIIYRLALYELIPRSIVSLIQ